MSPDPRESQLQVPKSQKVAMIDEKSESVSIQDAPVIQEKDLEPGQALVRVIYSGVCHTDLHAMLGDWPVPTKKNLIGGHEGAGVVVALGPGSDKFLQKGDRVGIKWLADSCLQCESCNKGYEPVCGKAQTSGYSVDGSFQQYAVSFARHLTKIPDALPLADAAPILCAGVTVYKALKEAQQGGDLRPGDWVAIPGCGGGLGHLAVQYASNMGFRVLGIDTGSEKKALATKLGAEAFVDFKTTKNLIEDVKQATDGAGPHAAVVAAAGGAAYEQALDYIRSHGVLVAVGLPPDATIKANVFFTVFRSLRIIGSYVGNRRDAEEALDIAARGKVKTQYATKKLSDLPKIYEEMKNGKIAGRIVIDIDQ